MPMTNDNLYGFRSRTILHNKAKCLKCGDVIESRYEHDFVTCSCGHLSVDGGRSYLRRVFTDDDWEELTEYEK